jgi:AcrR family transcriptional regulator
MEMATQTDPSAETRVPLSRERVLQAAVSLADEHGIEALSMRKLGSQLGVEAMSLYNHVKNKKEILDGMVELVVGEIDLSPDGADWKTALRNRILTARESMLRHRWAPGVMETQTTIGLAVILYFNALLGIFRDGGFSYDMAHHAMHALGSRALGFSQELFEPDGAEPQEDPQLMLQQMADQIPFIVEMMSEISHDDDDSTIGWCDDQTEFEFALDLILDGLERLRDTA